MLSSRRNVSPSIARVTARVGPGSRTQGSIVDSAADVAIRMSQIAPHPALVNCASDFIRTSYGDPHGRTIDGNVSSADVACERRGQERDESTEFLRLTETPCRNVVLDVCRP